MRIVVVGAGVAGLATAALLAKDGHEVEVLERGEEIGGRMGSLSEGGFRFDTGPSWYLMPEAFEHFYARFGTTPEREFGLTRLDPAYRVFDDASRSVDVRTGHAEELFEKREPGAGKRVAKWLATAETSYRIALESFLYTTFSRPGRLFTGSVLRRLPLLFRLLSRPLSAEVRRRFRDPQLRQLLEYPAVFLSSRPERVPALYHLMSHTDLSQGVFYPSGGFVAFAESLAHLARDHGARIHLGCEVRRIRTRGGRATGVECADGTVFPADVVVSAADRHHTETVLLRRREPRRWLRRDPGISCVLIYLGVRGGLPELAHHNLLLPRNWEEDFDAVSGAAQKRRDARALYVCRASATDPTVAPRGHENLFVLVPTAADPDIGRGDAYGPGSPNPGAWDSAESPEVRRIADAAVARLAQWAEIPDLAQRIVVRRTVGPADFAQRYHSWRGGAIGPAHTLRQSAFLRWPNRDRRVRNLLYAGGTVQPGVGLPMCLISAENVLTRGAELGLW